jgi:hypothetical protein
MFFLQEVFGVAHHHRAAASATFYSRPVQMLFIRAFSE